MARAFIEGYVAVRPPSLKTSFKMDWNNLNVYNCNHCMKAGRCHFVIDATGPPTHRYSHWGGGLPTSVQFCTGCKRWSGPWVSADIVGGGW